MKIRLSPILDIDDPELLLSVLELFAFARGEALFSDLDIDFETVLQDVEATPEHYCLDDERDLLRNEPVAARQLLEELAMDKVFRLVEERETRFGRNYAFKRIPEKPGTLLLKNFDELNGAAFATAWLSFFSALNAENLLNMLPSEKRAIRMLYAKVFELVALMAATSIGSAVGWWTGRSWTQDAKVQNFQRLCDLVGYGTVKDPQQWEEAQKQANDAGMDGFLVTTVGGKVSNASVCIALGATVQKKQRRKKKIGKDERDRLLAFYLHRPTIAMIGAAADPYDQEPVLEQDYANSDCLYLHGQILWDLLAVYEENNHSEALAEIKDEMVTTLKVEMKSVLEKGKIIIDGAEVGLTDTFGTHFQAA